MNIRLGLACLSLLVAGACGGEGDSDGGGGSSGSGGASSGASCSELAKTWCAKACACTAGEECTLVRANSTETHDTETMCVNFYGVIGCQSAPSDSAWNSGCAQALETAACGQSGLMHPSACDW